MSAEDRYPERIFVALRHVFEGKAADLESKDGKTKKKAIRKLVRGYLREDKGGTLRDIVEIHGMGRVSSIAGDLLSNHIFDSTCLASRRFPDLFRPPGPATAGTEIREKAEHDLSGSLGGLVDLAQGTEGGASRSISEPTVLEPLRCNHLSGTGMASPEDLYPERVYVALRHVFVGDKAKLRRTKPIRKLIYEHMSKGEGDTLKDIAEAHGTPRLVSIAQKLMADGLFESACLASRRFPRVFPTISITSNMENAENSPPDPNEAAVPALCQHCRIAFGIGEPNRAQLPCDANDDLGKKSPLQEWTELLAAVGHTNEIDAATCTIRLPFQVQYELMVQLQRVMEQVCFGFAKEALPELLEERQWVCAEGVELHLWKDELLKHKWPIAACELPTAAMERLLQTMAFIRHVAVIRINISVTQLQQCIKDAVDLTTALRQTRFLRPLFFLQAQVDLEILGLRDEEETQKQLLDIERSAIAKERAELDEREGKAIQKAEKQLAGCQNVVGARVQNIVCSFRDMLLAEPDASIGEEETREGRGGMIARHSDEDFDFCSSLEHVD